MSTGIMVIVCVCVYQKNMGGIDVVVLKTPPLIVDCLLAKTLRLCSVYTSTKGITYDRE
jgi:hypothetical protein